MPTPHPRRRQGRLLVVGVGISGPPQTTLETVSAIERADVVFYLVMDPTTEEWVRSLNPRAASLRVLYGTDVPRARTYRAMTRRITTAVRQGHMVCAVFYGHPGVFVTPAHAAIRQLRRSGHEARMLPGISADGCLFADLGIDPGVHGLQSFEATDFLLHRRRWDPTSTLLLWQIGVLGEGTGSVPHARQQRPRLTVLYRRLRRAYPATHRVILYEAPRFAGDPPFIRRLMLRNLMAATYRPVMTLYVAPRPARAPDRRVLGWLNRRAAGKRRKRPSL